MKELSEHLLSTLEYYHPLLLKLCDGEAAQPLAEEKWSRKQILGHLIDSASNNHQRFIRAQLASHLDLPGYQQNDWVNMNGYQQELWSDLIRLWSAYNQHLAHILAHLPEESLAHTISLDGNPPMTLQFIAEDYVRHLVHHLKQMNVEG